MTALQQQGAAAKAASRILMTAGEAQKNRALHAMADQLLAQSAAILAANAEDLAMAEANGMSKSLQDRLALSEKRLADMADGLRAVAALPDPIGEVVEGSVRPNGLQLRKVRVPLGVIGMIFEARPNVTSDSAGLCLKAGNAVILRGGKEAFRSNQAVVVALRDGLQQAGLPQDCVQLVQDTSRATATELMQLTDYLDVLIPRGGAGLIQSVVQNAKVPVIETGVGNCHIFLDESADTEMAAAIVFNAKTSRPSTCNTVETLLVHQAAAERLLPAVAEKLAEKNVELRACPRALALLPGAVAAQESDWETEFLDYILAVRVVDSLDEAITHIARYSSSHSECIVTENYLNALRFTQEVDSAAVYVNASTRFTDGGEFGLGAEIGISTQKMHVRGPMGILALTSTKHLIFGTGQIR
ncbi:MAG: glutamate-5-semialdehyde dehydrogenase [Clostridia bacterium]|nr:glutamate-5-semialdehyde dehydrogenase [Clostridia bacterium]